ncbi:helix-turn-helix transcriptional regulator [Amycolatopsis speibonae]|uniref:LuxR C-terminal-related transcriptional regulator n=1 Tax=Amycolatopsis speibonae TaxID=1450224 RepID=A0ABV7P4E5_9PSEU
MEDRSSSKAPAWMASEFGSFWQTSPTSHEECAAESALGLLARGVDRTGAVQRAESALGNASCLARPRCLWRGVTVLLCAGELVGADAQLRRLENTCDDRFADMFSLLRATHARLAGDLAGAQGSLAPLVTMKAAPFIRRVAMPFLLETLAVAGEVEEADALLREHEAGQRAAGEQTLRPLMLATRGMVHLAAGRYSEAVEDLLPCVRLPAANLAAHPSVMHRRGLAALAAGRGGRSQLADALATEEEESALIWGAPAHVGWALYVRAIVDGPAGATGPLVDAIELLEVSRTRVGLAEARYELGLRLAGAGDDITAKVQLEQAERSARQIGNKNLAARVEAVLGRLAHASAPRSLTGQEVKIAELARAGYTNRRIAEKLFLTVRTVEFHLSNVYRKLGIAGRRELMSGTFKLT